MKNRWIVAVAVMALMVVLVTGGSVLGGKIPDAATAPDLQMQRFETETVRTPETASYPIITASPGNLLWSANVADHARCVFPFLDVDGDGKPEVLGGIDDSQNLNLFCFSGGSSGTASVVWSSPTSCGVSFGAPNVKTSLAVSPDLSSDGFPDVLYGTDWGGRSGETHNGMTGAFMGAFDTYLDNDGESGWIYDIEPLPDLDGDTVSDIVLGVGSYADALFCVSGAAVSCSGSYLWKKQAADVIYTLTVMDDLNGDGVPEIFAAEGDNGNTAYMLDGDITPVDGRDLWTYSMGAGSAFASLSDSIPDLNDDGKREILLGTWYTNKVVCLDAVTGDLMWESAALPGYVSDVDDIADLDDDGRAEVLVSTWGSLVHCLRGVDGTQLWATSLGYHVEAVESLGQDVDDDGYEDLAAGIYGSPVSGTVFGISGRTGSVIWSYDTGKRVFDVQPIGDVNDDGYKDVVVATQNFDGTEGFWCIEGDSGVDHGPHLQQFRPHKLQIGGLDN